MDYDVASAGADFGKEVRGAGGEVADGGGGGVGAAEADGLVEVAHWIGRNFAWSGRGCGAGDGWCWKVGGRVDSSFADKGCELR